MTAPRRWARGRSLPLWLLLPALAVLTVVQLYPVLCAERFRRVPVIRISVAAEPLPSHHYQLGGPRI